MATLLSKQQCVALRPRTHFVRTYALYAMAINAGNEEETNRIPRCWLGPAGTNDNIIFIYLKKKHLVLFQDEDRSYCKLNVLKNMSYNSCYLTTSF